MKNQGTFQNDFVRALTTCVAFFLTLACLQKYGTKVSINSNDVSEALVLQVQAFVPLLVLLCGMYRLFHLEIAACWSCRLDLINERFGRALFCMLFIVVTVATSILVLLPLVWNEARGVVLLPKIEAKDTIKYVHLMKFKWLLVCYLSIVVVITPVVEEMFFRRYLVSSLSYIVSPPLSVFMSSVVFGLAHIDCNASAPVNAYAFVQTALFGMVMSMLMNRRSGLVYAVVSHAVYNYIAVLLSLARFIVLDYKVIIPK